MSSINQASYNLVGRTVKIHVPLHCLQRVHAIARRLNTGGPSVFFRAVNIGLDAIERGEVIFEICPANCTTVAQSIIDASREAGEE